MPFATPEVSTSNPQSSDGSIAAAAESNVEAEADAEMTNQEEKKSKPVFAVPSLPVKKVAAMPPPLPPPPLFPKEQEGQPTTDSDAEKGAPPAKDSKSSASNVPPLKYQKPAWSGYPNQQFYFEVIKNGIIVDKIQAPEKEYLTIGRLPMCDLEMEHPSLSRYHAVIQFKSNGESFIYDLNSSHGTKLNKTKIPPGMHVSLKPGDQLRFGESTRIYLFQTEEEVDQEEEDRKLVTAMIEKQNRSRAQQVDMGNDNREFNWGMQEDAVDEEEIDEATMDGTVRRAVDPDASYRADPKKALRNYLENKGYSCEYDVEESGPQHAKEYTARIRLPIETSMGPVYGQATAGKRRDAEREAALDACIQLDSRGMFGQKSSGEGATQSKNKYESSDDDDDFYDRTVKKKPLAKKTEQKAETHESLLEKQLALQAEMASLEAKIQEYDATAAARKQLEESGDLDVYMTSLEKSGGDSKAKMQQNLVAMKKEEKRLQTLIAYTKPMDIMAKIGAGAGAGATSKSSNNNNTDSRSSLLSSFSGNGKRQNECDTPTEAEAKKTRILGPSLPPS